MACSVFCMLVLLVLSITFTYSSADNTPSAIFCNQSTVINITSPISANIDHLLADVVTKFMQGATFAEASYGDGGDTVYGLAQCRGDVSPKDCLACLQDAAQQVRKLCFNQSDARIWYDYCFLRYTLESFHGNVDTNVGTLFKNTANVSSPDSFNQDLGKTFEDISSRAVRPSSGGIGKAKKKRSNFETLYALVQCTRDLAPVSCGQCLAIAIQNFEGFCSNSKGCRVLYSSCYVRYELYPFFFPLEDMMSFVNKGHTIKKTLIHHH